MFIGRLRFQASQKMSVLLFPRYVKIIFFACLWGEPSQFGNCAGVFNWNGMGILQGFYRFSWGKGNTAFYESYKKKSQNKKRLLASISPGSYVCGFFFSLDKIWQNLWTLQEILILLSWQNQSHWVTDISVVSPATNGLNVSGSKLFH